jgi:hypothetical protein
MSIADLKVIRTAVGFLLNASIGFGECHCPRVITQLTRQIDAIKLHLISLEAALTVMKLSTALYPPGAWLSPNQTPIAPTDQVEESWSLRSGLSNWAWRTILELKDTKDESAYIHNLSLFSPEHF